ncbi:MAG TPA: amidohydrolase [Nocardioidaceae bacterium]|nr:amidohydrolase [Nocardioidaceae bacterium]
MEVGTMNQAVVSGGRLGAADEPVDLFIQHGHIAAIEPYIEAHDATRIEASGLLLVPGLVDAHCHLDKTLFGLDWVPHTAGADLRDRIETERARRGELGVPSDTAMAALVEAMVTSGTTVARTHTDVFPEVGGAHVRAVQRVADRYRHQIEIQQVGFPQYGVLSSPETRGVLEELAADGSIAAVGGIDPAGVEGDPVAALDALFEIAAQYGIGVDIHLHDHGTLGLWQLEAITRHTTRFDLAGRVNVSHAYALGEADVDTQRLWGAKLADAGVSLVTAAVYDFPVPQVDVMRAAGVALGIGNDGVRDLWGPYGDGDMLRRAMLVAYRCGFRRDELIGLTLDAATTQNARILGLPPAGLAPGAPADIVAVAADSPAAAVATCPPRSWVMKNGRVVARDGALVRGDEP